MPKKYDKTARLIYAEEIGSRIKSIARRKKNSQRYICKKMGISQTSMQSWINGITLPDTFYLRQITTLLGIDFNWLLTGDDASSSYNRIVKNTACETVPIHLELMETINRLAETNANLVLLVNKFIESEFSKLGFNKKITHEKNLTENQT